MTVTAQTPIVGVGGTLAEAVAWARRRGAKRLSDAIAYLTELDRLCRMVPFDFRILASQSAWETADWTSAWWVGRLNPAGIGITGDPAQDAASATWATGTDAARAHVVHMFAYARYGEATPVALRPYFALDPRFNAVVAAGLAGSVRVLGDLGNGRWATDPGYAAGIAAKANAIFADSGIQNPEADTPPKEEPTVPETKITYGRVPYPIVVKSPLTTVNPWVKTGAPAVPLAVVWHRMVGSWEGTNGWFHAGNAATAYGVSVAAMDGAGGRIYEWLGPDSGLYGESSGPVSAPYGDGLAYVNEVGVGAVNRLSRSIEISGNYDTPLDDAAKNAVAALTAYWADRARIPWDAFPAVPGKNRSFVLWHQEITIGTGKVCPGQVVMDATPDMIERTRAVLKRYQETDATTTPKPKPAAPVPSVPWDKTDVGPRTIGDTPALAFLGLVTARRDVPVYASAGKGARRIGTVAQGKTAVIRGTFRSGNARYALIELPNGAGVGRASLSAFFERFPLP